MEEVSPLHQLLPPSESSSPQQRRSSGDWPTASASGMRSLQRHTRWTRAGGREGEGTAQQGTRQDEEARSDDDVAQGLHLATLGLHEHPRRVPMSVSQITIRHITVTHYKHIITKSRSILPPVRRRSALRIRSLPRGSWKEEAAARRGSGQQEERRREERVGGVGNRSSTGLGQCAWREEGWREVGRRMGGRKDQQATGSQPLAAGTGRSKTPPPSCAASSMGQYAAEAEAPWAEAATASALAAARAKVAGQHQKRRGGGGEGSRSGGRVGRRGAGRGDMVSWVHEGGCRGNASKGQWVNRGRREKGEKGTEAWGAGFRLASMG